MKRTIGLLAVLVAMTGILLGQASHTQAQIGQTVWVAQFYNNPYFLDGAVFEERRTQVDFNFGTSAPREGFPSENYSVRVSTDVFIPAGNYRFYLLADDGATVTFDYNQRVIRTFEEPRPGDLITGDLAVGISGVYHIQIDYRQAGGSAYLYFDFESLDNGVQGPNFTVINPSVPPADANLQSVGNLFWTGQYYANRGLTGSPSVISSNVGLQFNWGAGAPFPNLPADNFSARWNSTYTFDGSEYVIQVQSDDGVRVYIDGVLVLNEWRDATNQTFRVAVRPAAGSRVITVEYYEAFGVAFIDFQLFRRIAQPAELGSPYNAFATVTAGRLNVRNAPNALTGLVVGRVSNGERYPIVGRRADNLWVQINTGNVTGWVSGQWVSTTNLQNVPVTSGEAAQPQQPQNTGFTAFTRTEVNLRTGPATSFGRILIVPQNVTVNIVGRNTRATWWQVNYNGTTGWVSADFAVIEQANPDLNRIPITTE